MLRSGALRHVRTSWVSAVAGIVVTAGAMTIAGIPSAQALTLSTGQIGSFDVISWSGIPGFHQNAGGSPAVNFSTIFNVDNPNPSYQTITIGNDSLSQGFGAGEYLYLTVDNTNENPWDFTLEANGSSSGVVSILDGSSAILKVFLGAIDGTLTSVRLTVGALLPMITPNANGVGSHLDYTAEYNVAPVPIPPALALFGGGLAGIALLARRRKQKPVGDMDTTVPMLN